MVLHGCSCRVGDAVPAAPHGSGHADHIPELLGRAESVLCPCLSFRRKSAYSGSKGGLGHFGKFPDLEKEEPG